MDAIADSGKKRGRPSTGIGKSTGLRLYREEEAALDVWIASLPEPRPTRPEAIRRALGEFLRDRGYLPAQS
jgi:hypothetical protein